MRTASSCFVVLAILIAVPAAASAQTAEAETLFREGMRLMKQRRFAQACEKLEASERIEPAVGTEYNLANCRDKNGQTASAWAMFLKAAATAKRANDDREADARERAKLLADQLVYLTIEVPAEAELDDLVIKRNETPIDRGLWDSKVPVDPDEYTIRAEAAGYKAWSKTVVVKTKNKVIEIPKLERRSEDGKDDTSDGRGTSDQPNQSDRTGPSDRTDPNDRSDQTDRRDRGAHGRKYRTAAITLGVVGGAGIVLGTSFALYSRHLESRSDTLCPMIRCADSYGVALNETARLDAKIANISWGIGAAALVGGLALWWIGRPTRGGAVALVPVVDGERAALSLGGQF